MTAPLADAEWTDPATLTRRAHAWAATMEGHRADIDVRVAHTTSTAAIDLERPLLREEREVAESASLAPGATRAHGAGHRAVPEEPDPVRTCFERDRDRILHSSAYRRLAGKTQVFVFPSDHQRTRLTHALEVAQVARSIAAACRLNVALAEAIALGHDCGHGPGGHASEDALSPYVSGGFDHAAWGADVTLSSLNLCRETLDGIRNHSWSRPAPSTPEGEVVSWADRIAYVCHDFEDAAHAGIVDARMLPELVRTRCGTTRSSQLNGFIVAMVEAVAATGRIGMVDGCAEALATFRRWNYEHIYLRPASRAQAQAVTEVLQALVEHFADRPHAMRGLGLVDAAGRARSSGKLDAAPGGSSQTLVAGSDDGMALLAGSAEALHAAVAYVAGMTDRYAFQTAVAELGWDPAKLPRGVGTAR